MPTQETTDALGAVLAQTRHHWSNLFLESRCRRSFGGATFVQSSACASAHDLAASVFREYLFSYEAALPRLQRVYCFAHVDRPLDSRRVIHDGKCESCRWRACRSRWVQGNG